ncbi:ATP-binding cassette domain-containing protein [Georgenia thermotolerans]|uniref:ATP-binding cassette domain-containing protein n=1 Tax=Georgenia thermotolerans TaxID=527326 RepID=A0A7J5UKI1_9MICO|nr:ABC transporter ATP-binding protein [Georgenia thermotolerans]KAE8762781.1 ATP-binding cassette domain-containing protein [Georgenia thermotolerans]
MTAQEQAGFGVAVRDLTVRYGRTTALDGVTFDLPVGGIYGLLGRNGSGKTTLLSVLAAFRRAASGEVRVDGEDPFENARVMGGTSIVREGGDVLAYERIATNLRYVAAMRPGFDTGLAEELLDAFAIDRRKTPDKLSRGQRSALGATIGLATRAPLSIFDEVHLGMDAPSRQRFYDVLLADVVAHPRTVILSSHLIGEIEHLLERVVILDAGRVLLCEETDALRARGVTITGPADRVDAAVAGLGVVGTRDLGATRQVTVFDDLDDGALDRAAAAGLELGGVPLQDLFIHLTARESR